MQAKKKAKKSKTIDELKEARLELAGLHGFLSRLHGYLNLPYCDNQKEIIDMLRKWLSLEVNKENEKIDSF